MTLGGFVGLNKQAMFAAPIGLSLVMALAAPAALAETGRVTATPSNAVTNAYGECWNATGGTKNPMEACGDVIAKPAPVETKVDVEVVVTETAASVTETVVEKVTIDAAMLFGFDSAELSDDAKAIIDERIDTFRGRAKLTSIMRVVGHTDSTGPEEYNLELSKRRAQAVADYIAAKSYNVRASDIEVIGKGESDPIAANDTAEGRAANRRVDIFAEAEIGK